MRVTLIIAFVFFFLDVYSQSKVDSITMIQKKLKLQVEKLNDSIDKLERLKSLAYQTETVKKYKNKIFYGVVKSNRPVRVGIDPTSDTMGFVLKGDSIVLIKYTSDGFFKVCSDSFCGYLNDMWIQKDSNVIDFLVWGEIEIQEQDLAKRMELDKKKLELEKKYIQVYGKTVYTKLTKGYIWLGMTKEMARISQGPPNDINRSVGSWGVHEQWVYGNGFYLYFENGKLTSWQD